MSALDLFGDELNDVTMYYEHFETLINAMITPDELLSNQVDHSINKLCEIKEQVENTIYQTEYPDLPTINTQSAQIKDLSIKLSNVSEQHVPPNNNPPNTNEIKRKMTILIEKPPVVHTKLKSDRGSKRISTSKCNSVSNPNKRLARSPSGNHSDLFPLRIVTEKAMIRETIERKPIRPPPRPPIVVKRKRPCGIRLPRIPFEPIDKEEKEPQSMNPTFPSPPSSFPGLDKTSSQKKAHPHPTISPVPVKNPYQIPAQYQTRK